MKKGFIDTGLYGLKEKLAPISKEENSDKKYPVTEPESNNNSIENRVRHDEYQDESTKLDKNTIKALLKRRQEYIRTKKHVIDNINKISSSIEEKTSSLQAEIVSFNEALARINSNLSEIKNINEKDWKDNYTFQLGSAMKIVENARLQYLLTETKFFSNDEKVPDKINSRISIIPELTSLNFSQLFKMGLSFTMPLVIGTIIAAILVSLTIFIVMGGTALA